MSEATDKPLPDEQLDEYLKGDSSVSRQYRQLHSDDVPAELDRVVMRQAHDSVKAAPAKSRAWTRWTGPLAMAASAVLVVSIVMETSVQDDVALTAAKAPAPAAAPRMETKRQSESAESEVADIIANQAPVSPQFAPTPPATQDQAAPREPQSPILILQEPKVMPPEVAIEVPIEPPAERAELPPSQMIRRERRDAVAPPPVAAPQSTPKVTSRPASQTEADTAEVMVTGNTGMSREAGAAEPRYTDPEHWLRDIRQLREQNQQEQADREWRRFREAFPNHPVSETDAAREADGKP